MFLYLFPLIEDHVFQQGPVLQPFDVARTNKVWTKTLTFLAWRGQQISRAVLPRTAGFMQGISGSSIKLSRIPRNVRILGLSQVTHSCSRFFQNMKTWKIMEHLPCDFQQWGSERIWKPGLWSKAVWFLRLGGDFGDGRWMQMADSRIKKKIGTKARRVLGHSFE